MFAFRRHTRSVHTNKSNTRSNLIRMIRRFLIYVEKSQWQFLVCGTTPYRQRCLFLGGFQRRQTKRATFYSGVFPLRSSRPSFFRSTMYASTRFAYNTRHVSNYMFRLTKQRRHFGRPTSGRHMGLRFLPTRFAKLCAYGSSNVVLRNILYPGTILQHNGIGRANVLSRLLTKRRLLRSEQRHIVCVPQRRTAKNTQVKGRPLLMRTLYGLLRLCNHRTIMAIHIFLRFNRIMGYQYPSFLHPFPCHYSTNILYHLTVLMRYRYLPTNRGIIRITRL